MCAAVLSYKLWCAEIGIAIMTGMVLESPARRGVQRLLLGKLRRMLPSKLELSPNAYHFCSELL